MTRVIQVELCPEGWANFDKSTVTSDDILLRFWAEETGSGSSAGVRYQWSPFSHETYSIATGERHKFSEDYLSFRASKEHVPASLFERNPGQNFHHAHTKLVDQFARANKATPTYAKALTQALAARKKWEAVGKALRFVPETKGYTWKQLDEQGINQDSLFGELEATLAEDPELARAPERRSTILELGIAYILTAQLQYSDHTKALFALAQRRQNP